MKRYRIPGILLLFVTCVSAYAQSLPGDSLKYSNLPKHAVKFSPLSLLTFYPTIQVAYETRLVRNISMQVDLGYVLSTPSALFESEDDDMSFKDMRGAKLKLELRYYAPFSLKFKRAHHYFSLEPYLNTVRFNRDSWVTQCFDVECTAQFRQLYTYKMQYREGGASFKYGIQIYSEKLIFDFSAGLRIRDIYYSDAPEFDGVIDDITTIFFDIPNETNRTVTEPVLSAKIGYRIR